MNILQPITKWHELATFSQYQTATAIRDELLTGDIKEAMEGIEELIAALSRSDQRELKSQLIRLMAHIIKWKSQPARRSRSWVITIVNARVEIETLLEFELHLKPMVPDLLQELLSKAKRIAAKEMGMPSIIETLSWQEVFEDDYA